MSIKTAKELLKYTIISNYKDNMGGIVVQSCGTAYWTYNIVIK